MDTIRLALLGAGVGCIGRVIGPMTEAGDQLGWVRIDSDPPRPADGDRQGRGTGLPIRVTVGDLVGHVDGEGRLPRPTRTQPRTETRPVRRDHPAWRLADHGEEHLQVGQSSSRSINPS
jgi:hypothetical protein